MTLFYYKNHYCSILLVDNSTNLCYLMHNDFLNNSYIQYHLKYKIISGNNILPVYLINLLNTLLIVKTVVH